MSAFTKREKWQSGRVLESFDSFGEAVPGFNVKGQDMVTTRVGGVVTVIIGVLVLIYASLKFTHLTTRYNPQMSSYFSDLKDDEVLDLAEETDFMIAFSIEDFHKPRQLKNDPKYVKWIFRTYTLTDGVSSHRELSTHMCTEEDFAKFYPIKSHQASLLEEINNDPDRGFFCLDEVNDEKLELYGLEVYANY